MTGVCLSVRTSRGCAPSRSCSSWRIHAGLPLPGGFSGVDVFFASRASSSPRRCCRELSTDGRIDLWRFYARRVGGCCRLSPHARRRRAARNLREPAGSAANRGAHRDRRFALRRQCLPGAAADGLLRRQLDADPLLHTWTLAVEEQFYLFFPLLLLLGWACARRTAAAALVAAISVGSFAAAVALAGTSLGFYSAFTRAWEFGAGALIAIAAPWLARIPPRFAALVGAAGLAAIGLTAFGVRETAGDPRDVLLAVGGTCALLLAGARARPRVCSLLHRPCGSATSRTAGTLALAADRLRRRALAGRPRGGARRRSPVARPGVALVPLRREPDPARRPFPWPPRLRLAGACIAVPVAASLALLATNSVLLRSPAITSWQASRAVHADQTRGCDRPDELERCLWRSRGSNGRVVLVGDSQAGQFTEPVVRAAARAGYDAVVATRNACPFGAVVVTRAPDTAEACARFNDGTMDALTRMRPDVVVLASRSDFYVGDVAARAQQWRRGLAAVIERLNDVGTHVVVVHPIPRLEAAPYGCAASTIIVRACSGAVSRTARNASAGWR